MVPQENGEKDVILSYFCKKQLRMTPFLLTFDLLGSYLLAVLVFAAPWRRPASLGPEKIGA
jgi:hypothetical protein